MKDKSAAIIDAALGNIPFRVRSLSTRCYVVYFRQVPKIPATGKSTPVPNAFLIYSHLPALAIDIAPELLVSVS